MTRNKKLGLFLIISPWIILVTLLLFFIIVGYIGLDVMNYILPPPPPPLPGEGAPVGEFSLSQVILSTIRFGLFFLVIVDAVYIVIGLLLGIHFLKKKNLPEINKVDQKVKNKKIGLFFLASPWIILASSIISFYICSWLVENINSHHDSILFILSLLWSGSIVIGVLNIIYIFIGLGLGIHFLKKAKRM